VPEKRHVILSPTAVADLDAVDDPLHARIVKRLHLLSRFPELGSPMGREFAGWRQSPVVIFRIIYRVTPHAIKVAYIRHCKRRLPHPAEEPV